MLAQGVVPHAMVLGGSDIRDSDQREITGRNAQRVRTPGCAAPVAVPDGSKLELTRQNPNKLDPQATLYVPGTNCRLPHSIGGRTEEGIRDDVEREP